MSPQELIEKVAIQLVAVDKAQATFTESLANIANALQAASDSWVKLSTESGILMDVSKQIAYQYGESEAELARFAAERSTWQASAKELEASKAEVASLKSLTTEGRKAQAEARAAEAERIASEVRAEAERLKTE